MKYIYVFILTVLSCHCFAQQDTLKTHQLNEVIVTGQGDHGTIERLPETRKTFIWSGKKNEVINLQNMDANVSEKTGRQIFAKVPGVFVYDMDGTGNQTNIATRGLDPHRGWEFNLRRNGAIVNSDLYAYPASHYSMPMEAVSKIELVRGTGSLQYGAQFGGMLNYVSKQPDTTKAITFESINAIGSFGHLSTYNAISGTIGKFQYHVYYSMRKSEGYRDNSRSDYDGQSVMLVYNPADNLKITGELSRSNYVYQIPGPLTDSMFYADPTQSTRARNYFSPEIYVPSLKFEWGINSKTDLLLSTSAVIGERNSVMFDRTSNIPDAINPETEQYAQRQIDIDHFNSFTTELRVSRRYSFLNSISTLAAGVQLMNNNTNRQQLGKGTTGTDFDLALVEPGFGRDLHYKTRNIAFFVENNFHLTEKLSINPGFRIEAGESNMYGTTTYYGEDDLPNTLTHKFPLFGVSGQYAISRTINIYGGWSQSYRPVLFKDMIPGNIFETVNKDLMDAYGYNAEVGFRGAIKGLRWDVTFYQLQYTNRMGTQATQDENGTFILYRTNIGDSKTNGVELFLQYSTAIGQHLNISLFTSTAFLNAKYKNATIRSGNNNVDISGNKVESTPGLIMRNGITLKSYFVSITFLHSYTGESYADPLNTERPSATGAVGIVPSYSLLDINSTFTVSSRITVKFNFNNVADKQYFTKRPTMYPGAGVWPSDGRSLNLSVGLKI
jgi:Fe(3+) dicitrate transport protein